MKIFLYTFLGLLFFSGCASKNYYEPKKLDGSISFANKINSHLSEVSRDGATFKNGMFVTRLSGIEKYKLPKGFRFVSKNKDLETIAVSNNGDIAIFVNGVKKFEKKFETAISGASLHKNLLAIVFSNNTIMLYDIKADKKVYTEELESTLALDARVANPLFLNDLVIFPTLDGRLLVMDVNRKQILRDVAISDKELFNNVIFLEVHNNILIAATASKVVSINPKTINTLRVPVKDLLYINDKVYIFTKNGKVILSDNYLKVIKEIKFPFAIFSTLMYADKIHAVEKGGYLISLDKDLSGSSIYKLDDDVEKPLFGFGNSLILDNKLLLLK
jgi:hypothetical protein